MGPHVLFARTMNVLLLNQVNAIYAYDTLCNVTGTEESTWQKKYWRRDRGNGRPLPSCQLVTATF